MFSKIITFIILILIFSDSVNAKFAFGVYPEDNNAQEIVDIELKYLIHSNLVGFIFDSFTERDAETLSGAISTLGTNRIYHVSISPFGLSTKDVAEGKYDEEYMRFFSIVKNSKARFLFRTMHEMNGSWYSWSGNPESFQKAWQRVWQISRAMELTQRDILFIFSVNSQDLPSINGSVGGEMVFCSPTMKKKTKCISFEDYFPGEEFVDIMGLTLYNWGRGRGEEWAKWRTFEDLLYDRNTAIFSRLKGYGKKIFLDEVGTTAVNFKGTWDIERVRDIYTLETLNKNTWIDGMSEVLSKESAIVGMLYFNRDKTDGLQHPKVGELDWSALSLRLGKEYSSILPLFSNTNSSYLPFDPPPQSITVAVKRLNNVIMQYALKYNLSQSTVKFEIIERITSNMIKRPSKEREYAQDIKEYLTKSVHHHGLKPLTSFAPTGVDLATDFMSLSLHTVKYVLFGYGLKAGDIPIV